MTSDLKLSAVTIRLGGGGGGVFIASEKALANGLRRRKTLEILGMVGPEGFKDVEGKFDRAIDG